jgi:hypothetical protein
MFPRDMDSLARSLFAPFGIRSHDISTIDLFFFLGRTKLVFGDLLDG